jgi:hypothetical protein
MMFEKITGLIHTLEGASSYEVHVDASDEDRRLSADGQNQ